MGERNNPLMKKLDKWIGCPLLFVLGLFHKKRSVKDIKNTINPQIAIIKTAGIGDTIVLSAIVDEIKSEYPDSSITWICAANNLGMVNALKDKGIDEVFCFEMKSPIRALKGIKALGHFDYVLDFAPWARINAVISWALSGKFKAGFKRKSMYRHYVYDAWAEHLDTKHEVDNYREILKIAGMDIKEIMPSMQSNESSLVEGNYIVFHVYPGGSLALLKRWPEENWIRLAKEISSIYGYRILFSGGRNDSAALNGIVSQLSLECVKAVNIAGDYSLQEMINVLKNAKAVVSVDTGIMHLAAAAEATLIALLGPTADERWGPLSDKAIVVSSKEKCSPCISLGFDSVCKKAACMENISVEMVLDVLKKIL